MGGGLVADEVFLGVVAGFGHRLHEAGVPVTPERAARFARAISAAQPDSLADVYWLGRTTLLSGRSQIEVYDRLFDHVFRGQFSLSDLVQETATAPAREAPTADRSPEDGAEAPESAASGGVTTLTPGVAAESEQDEQEPQALAAVSITERLVDRDFSACSDEELALIRRLVDELPLMAPPRLARRQRRHSSGRRLDVRSTLRRSQRTGGDPVALVRRTPTERPRRIVLIADVSGSMEPYARVYLHLMRGAVQALGAEAFAFATRLTRLTRQLAAGDANAAYARALESAPDWSGGTRIGRALTTFLDDHGRRGMARGAVLVIVSDGWEIEDPALVGTAMQRLSRLAHHIIWVNPRTASASYQPLVGGMAAALPYVDTLVSGHSVRALEEVMAAIRGAAERRPARNERTRVPA